MNEKNLNKLKRSELLEIMLTQSREIESLKDKLKKAEEIIEDKRICIDRAGSIADAALTLNGVFESAQKAASQYLSNIEQLESRLQKKEELLSSAWKKMDDFLLTLHKEHPEIVNRYQKEIMQLQEMIAVFKEEGREDYAQDREK